MIGADFILYNVGTLHTCAGPAPRRGDAMRRLAPVAGGAVASSKGRIVYVGADQVGRHVEPAKAA